MCLNTKRKRSSFVFVCACLSATFIISQALRNETSHEPAVHGNLEASYANSSVKGNTNCSFHDDSWRRVEVIAFTHDGDIKEWQLVSLTLARYFNPRACLLVLTNNAALRSHDVVLKLKINVDLIAPDDLRVVELAKNYKHSSSNSEYFELHCLSRFIYLDNFVSTLPKTWQIDVWHLDLDVVLFSTLQQPFAQIQVWALTPTSTYFARFSRASLHDFSEFIIHLYGKSVDELTRFISRYGNDSEHVKNSSLLWRSTSVQSSPKQFSDMHVFHAWTEDFVARNEPVFFFHQSQNRPFPAPNACVDGKDLVNITWYETDEQLLKSIGISPRLRFPLLRGHSPSLEPILALHFQGGCKSRLCQVVCPMLRADDATLIECCRRSKNSQS